MKTRLLKNIKEDEINEQKSNFLQALGFRKRLEEVLEEEIQTLQNAMLDANDYDSPNWQLIQVDRLSQIKSMKKVLTFLK